MTPLAKTQPWVHIAGGTDTNDRVRRCAISGIIQRLVSIGCVVIEQAFVDPGDIDLFTKAYGTYPELCIPFPKLTSRQEARIEYLAHILKHGQLSPADFNQPGDLYI